MSFVGWLEFFETYISVAILAQVPLPNELVIAAFGAADSMQHFILVEAAATITADQVVPPPPADLAWADATSKPSPDITDDPPSPISEAWPNTVAFFKARVEETMGAQQLPWKCIFG